MNSFCDFDWSARVALSSNKMSSMNVSLLQLKVETEKNGDMSGKVLELDEIELKLLLAKLTAARRALD